MERDYSTYFEALGVRPGCTWAQLRDVYRQRIRLWHPDRHQDDARQRQAAEEKTKEINHSFHVLSQYYKAFGCLPEVRPVVLDADNSITTKTSPAHGATVGAYPRPAPTATKRRTQPAAVALTLLAAGYVGYLSFSDKTTGQHAQPSSPNLEVTSSQAQSPRRVPESYFTTGSTMGEVLAVQGPPSRTDNNVWYYGSSLVHFENGAVTRWSSHRDTPLHARIDLAQQPAPRHFRVGDTRAQVLAAQGKPSRTTDEAWDYGVSRVYFRGDRVVGWDNSALSPLKVVERGAPR